MKRRTFNLACLMICFGLGLPSSTSAQPKGTDPLSGSWSGDWGPSADDRNAVTVDLKWDGKALTGTVNPGPNSIPVKNATFDAKTGAVHMEADTKNRRGVDVHFVIDGKLDASTMAGSWNHDTRKGDFKITRK